MCTFAATFCDKNTEKFTTNTLTLGVSAFVGLATACILLPLNQFASKFVVVAQDNLMKARDERVALINEVLGAIRMLKVSNVKRIYSRMLEIYPGDVC